MNTTPRPGLPADLVLFAAALVAGVALVLLMGGGILWTRPLWTDELCTLFVAGHDSLLTVMRVAAAGGDWSPPLLHLVVWAVRAVVGDVTPVILRTLSLAFVLGALLFVYATLRRRVSPSAAASGALVVALHPLVVAHAFEGRPYGPWLLFAAGLAWSLGLPASRRRDAAVAVFAVLMCTIHWFGVVALSITAFVVALTRPGYWRERARPVAPAMLGLVALALCVPMLLGQRASAEGLLWVRSLEWEQVRHFGRTFWLPVVPVAAVLLVARQGWNPGGRLRLRQDVAPVIRDPGMIALASLALMPLAIIVISVVFQPSMVSRYAIVAVLAWAPLAALGAEAVGRATRVALLALLAAGLFLGGARVAQQKRDFAETVLSTRRQFEQATALGLPVLFQHMHLMYAVVAPLHEPGSPARFLDLPDSTLLALYPSDRMEWLRDRFRVERGQARLHAGVYGFPVLATQAALDSMPRFLLLATDLQLSGGYKQAEKWGQAVFPRHRVERLSESLTLFERGSAAAPGSASSR